MADREIVINGVWGKIISGMGVIGLAAAVGAGVRLEVLAKDVDNHKDKPIHEGGSQKLETLEHAIIRQEAINTTVKRTEDRVNEIDRKIDLLLRSRGVNPSGQ